MTHLTELAPRQLMPCPFCGSQPKINTLPPGSGGYSTLSCPKCTGVYGRPTVYVVAHTEDECAIIWNRRGNV